MYRWFVPPVSFDLDGTKRPSDLGRTGRIVKEVREYRESLEISGKGFGAPTETLLYDLLVGRVQKQPRLPCKVRQSRRVVL